MQVVAQNDSETFEQERNKVRDQLISRLGDRLESVLYYPHVFPRVDYRHPFAYGGFVVVFHDEVEQIVDAIAAAHSCVPPETALYCLRRRELFELSLPVFWFLRFVDHQMHLPWFVKYKGEVLFGRDLRDEIQLPANPRLLFHNKLEVCAHFLRSGVILELLVQGRYELLIRRLERQMKYLMASALLAHGEWDITLADVAEKFMRRYTDPKLNSIWRDFGQLCERNGSLPADEACQAAYEAAWLFETFLHRLWGELKSSQQGHDLFAGRLSPRT